MINNVITNNRTKLNNIYYNSKNANVKIKNNPIDLQKNFLKILVEQIKNQDPLNPISNTELISQIAQIKTAANVEKIQTLINTLIHQTHFNKLLNIPTSNIKNDIINKFKSIHNIKK